MTSRNQTVIQIGPYLRARSAERHGLDLVEAWKGRRAQLLEEAEQLTHEFEAAAGALAEAVDRFGALAASARSRLAEVLDQVAAIDQAIVNWSAIEATATDVETGGG